jgi:hypothetical protein
MRKILFVVVALAAAGGCKKKSNNNATGAGGSGASGATGGSGDTAAGGGGGTMSATTESTGPLKPVNECPPALKDADKGLQRTIPAGCTTSVEGEYYVDGELIIEAGATLKFKPDAAMYIGYTGPSKLIVHGTKDKPVTFTSGGDAAAGVWKGVHLYSHAARSEITGLVIEYAANALWSEADDLTVKDSSFKNAKEIGVKIDETATLTAFAGNTFDKAGDLAMTVPPSALAGLGANTFAPDAWIELRGGAARKSATWANPGAPFKVTGEVYIDGDAGSAAVEIAAGNRFKFDTSGAIYVGYGGDSTLTVKGTKDAPVVFMSAGDAQPGAWGHGIIAYQHGAISLDYAKVQHGGADGKGAVRAEGGKLSITNSIINDNVVGVSLDDQSELKAFDANETFNNHDWALVLHPKHLGVLGATNKYAADQMVEVQDGAVDKAATWALQENASISIHGEVYIDGGSVTIPAGAEYSFNEQAAIYVGYGKPGTLVIQGTKAKPVVFKGGRDEVGTWKGVELYGQANASSIENLVVKNAGGAAGVRVSGGGSVKVNGLTCSKCEAAALTWDCGSKVTQTGVKGDSGTPKGAIAPDGC